MARLSQFVETRTGRGCLHGVPEARNSGLGTVGVREESPAEGSPLRFTFSKLFTLKETRGEGSGGGGRRPGETALRNVTQAGHLVLPWPLPLLPSSRSHRVWQAKLLGFC